jgi:hypothetical protein
MHNLRLLFCKLDWSLLTFNFVLALLVGLLFGLIPAWAASKPRLNELLKREMGVVTPASVRCTGSRCGQSDRHGNRLVTRVTRGRRVAAENFARLSNEKLGFEPKGVITTTAEVSRPQTKKHWLFYEPLLDRIRNVPGVKKIAVIPH